MQFALRTIHVAGSHLPSCRQSTDFQVGQSGNTPTKPTEAPYVGAQRTDNFDWDVTSGACTAKRLGP